MFGTRQTHRIEIRNLETPSTSKWPPDTKANNVAPTQVELEQALDDLELLMPLNSAQL